MTVLAALQALAATGAFASRAFLPAFIVALVARYPQLLSWLPLVPERPVVLSPELAWLRSDVSLVVLGLLATLEILADRNPEARDVLREITPWLKAGVAVFVTFAVVDGQTTSVLQRLAGTPAPLLVSASSSATAFVVAESLLAGLIVLALARARETLLETALHADGDGSLGILRTVSHAETAWAACVAIAAIAAPILAILLVGAVLAALALARRELEARAESRRILCSGCGGSRRPDALACPQCGQPGTPLAEACSRAWPDRWLEGGVTSPAARGLDLLGQGRCPACAERRRPEELLGAAPHACGWPDRARALGVPGADWPAALHRHVLSRARRLLPFVTLAGFLLVVGGALAVVLARLRVSAPLGRYLPLPSRLLARWSARTVTLLLLLGAGVPVVSAVTAALTVLAAGRLHGGAFEATVVRRRGA